MLIIPAIDLKDGRCVRLRQGDMQQETVYSDDVRATARHWQRQGAQMLHVVDLNGAVGGMPANLPQIETIVEAVSIPVQVGGGIRGVDTVRRYLALGVERIVLGTAALHDRSLIEEACAEFPGRIVLGLDAKNGKVAVKGWTAVSDTDAIELLRTLAGLKLGAVIYTDISRDGMLAGPNLEALEAVLAASPFPVIASGGISTVQDLREIRVLGPRIAGAIIGKALYDGKLDFAAALRVTRDGSWPC